MSSLAESPIPESVRAVLALFEGPLAELRFPQIDGERLATQAAEVERCRVELQRALETVQAARSCLEHEQQTLLEQARQAHAYATVYAMEDPPLAEQLAAIKLDARALAPPKKRGRKPKQAKNQTTLNDRQVERGGLSLSEDAA